MMVVGDATREDVCAIAKAGTNMGIASPAANLRIVGTGIAEPFRPLFRLIIIATAILAIETDQSYAASQAF
jgi:hypothetical protein